MSNMVGDVRDAVLRRVNRPLWHTVHRLTGVRLALDIEMEEIGQIVAAFGIDAEGVREWLPSRRLEPVEHAPGKTTVIVYGNDFRQVKLVGHPYGEVALGVPVTYRPRPAVPAVEGIFFLFLILNAQEGVWSGIEIWGYPKVLGEVQFQEVDGLHCCRAGADGSELLRLEAAQLPLSHETDRVNVFSVLDGNLVRTLWEAEGMMGRTDESGGGSCTLGNHPWAIRLRDWGMESSSLWHVYAPRLRCLLHKPGEQLPL